jgi:hypothetical protein
MHVDDLDHVPPEHGEMLFGQGLQVRKTPRVAERPAPAS